MTSLTWNLFRTDRTIFARRHSEAAPVLYLLLTTLVVISSGCTTTAYRASKLPSQFAAPPTANAQLIGLTALAQNSTPSNVIQPGDVLEVYIATGLEQTAPPTWTHRVGDDGTLDIPLIGSVRLAGLELTQADTSIRAAGIERGIYKNPTVSVLLKERKTYKITVVGEVKEPKAYELPVARSDLLSAVVEAGGLTEDADTLVEIRHQPAHFASGVQLASYSDAHQDRSLVRVDLREATRRRREDLRLSDGSVVMVMKRPERHVYVSGLVVTPDQYEMPKDQDLRLLGAVALAGGPRMQIADKVKIIRSVHDPNNPVIIKASLRQAKRSEAANLRLAPGDIVSIEETPTTFVVETVRSFVRFGFSSGVPLF